MEPRNFCFSTWTHRERNTGYPVNDSLTVLDFGPFKFRQLRYTIPKKGFGGASVATIQKNTGTRNKKILDQMRVWFTENILPCIADRLNPAAWLDLSQSLQRPELAREHGFALWKLEDRQSWIHESETNKIEQARSMGATPQL